MKKRIFTAAIAFVAAMSLSVSAFATANTPGNTNGVSVSKPATVEKDKAVELSTDTGVKASLPAGAFAEGTEVKLDTNVVPVNNESAVETVKTVNAKIAEVAKDVAADLKLNTKISISVLDKDGKPVQPAEGKKVTVTINYVEGSNVVIYVGDKGVEFFRLTVAADKKTATFETTHFSDFYQASVSEAALAKLAPASSTGDTTTPTDDKNKPTGVIFAIIPAAVAAAAVVVSKKRK